MASFFITGVKVGERKSMSECALAMAVQKWLNDETVWPYPVSNSFAILSRVACDAEIVHFTSVQGRQYWINTLGQE